MQFPGNRKYRFSGLVIIPWIEFRAFVNSEEEKAALVPLNLNENLAFPSATNADIKLQWYQLVTSSLTEITDIFMSHYSF